MVFWFIKKNLKAQKLQSELISFVIITQFYNKNNFPVHAKHIKHTNLIGYHVPVLLHRKKKNRRSTSTF